MLRFFSLYTFAFLFFLLLIACTPDSAPSTPTPPPLAEEIRFHSWVDDVPQEILDAFTERTGVRVVFITYETEEEPIAHLRDGEVFDVVVMNNEYVAIARQEGLLSELNFALLPNFRNISPNFRDLAYDPQNRHSIPYNWGTIGLVVNTEKVTTPITSWDAMWDEQFIGKVVIWNSPRSLIGATLQTLGYSPNTTDSDELTQAQEKLLALRPSVIGFVSASTDTVELLTSGEGAIAFGYVGDVFVAQEAGHTFEYILPEEGTLLWGDNFVIPKSSPNAHTAHLFLDFLLEAQSAATILEWNYYSTPNEGAQALVPEELSNNPLIFPPNEALIQAQLILSLAPELDARYNSIWEAFVTGDTAP